MHFIQSFLLLVFLAAYCSADDQSLPPPLRDFKDLQSYLAYLKQMSSDPTVANFLQESKPELDIYDHVKAVMEKYANERNNDIKYKSSVIVDQPNYPRSVTVYIEKDGEKHSCGLDIGETQTLTNFQGFTLSCIGGLKLKRENV